MEDTETSSSMDDGQEGGWGLLFWLDVEGGPGDFHVGCAIRRSRKQEFTHPKKLNFSPCAMIGGINYMLQCRMMPCGRGGWTSERDV